MQEDTVEQKGGSPAPARKRPLDKSRNLGTPCEWKEESVKKDRDIQKQKKTECEGQQHCA